MIYFDVRTTKSKELSELLMIIGNKEILLLEDTVENCKELQNLIGKETKSSVDEILRTEKLKLLTSIKYKEFGLYTHGRRPISELREIISLEIQKINNHIK